MTKRLFHINKNGEVVTVRQYYGRIAGRSGVKPRLEKKALKFIDISESTWRLSILMRDTLLDPQHTFADYNKLRKEIEKLRATFFARRSFNGGLKEAHRVAIDFAHFSKPYKG